MFNVMKRPRDDAEDCMDSADGIEFKKLRQLPFRRSPTGNHTSFFSQNRSFPKPPSLTPADSPADSDEELISPLQSMRQSEAAHFAVSNDDEMEVVDSHSAALLPTTFSEVSYGQSSSSASHSVRPAVAAVFTRRHLDLSARVPTPIYGHFPTTQQAVSLQSLHQGNSVVKSNTQVNWSGGQRRCPSPISENESMDTDIDINTNITNANNLLQDLDMSGTPDAAPSPDHESAIANTPATPFFPPNHPFSQQQIWGARRRSGAISNGESGGKTVVSMGFRADCDKCRDRVPGHYNHVLKV